MRLFSLSALLFSSGFCALVYQATWFREFRLIFGASTMASASVLALFMGGLGFGSLLLGKRVERNNRPILFYAVLELLITLSTAASPFLLSIVRNVYLSAGGSFSLGEVGSLAIRLLLALLVIGIPTFLMGGTFPALAKAISTDADRNRTKLSVLYGCNTLGAVLGTLLAHFVLIEAMGSRLTLWSACLVNLVVVVCARALDRGYIPEISTPKPLPEPAAIAVPMASSKLVLLAAALVGFSFMLMELVWYRLLSPLFGGSTFTFGIILAVALAGIGIGSICYPLIFAKKAPSVTAFATTCSIEALCLAIPFWLGDRLAEMAWLFRSLGTFGFFAQILGWILICMVVVFPAAIISGIQFPLLISLLGKGSHQVATDTAKTYVANTIGAICGSLAGGFGLLPLLSAQGSWKGVIVVLSAMAICFVLANKLLRPMPIVIALLASVLAFYSAGPTALWRHCGIGAGRAGQFPDSTNLLQEIRNYYNGRIFWQVDGVESGLAITNADGLAFIVNGKTDGSLHADAGTQIMAGLLPTMLHNNPKTACVIGLGTGSTAGWVAAEPSIESVDVLELEPAIAKFAEQCRDGNHNAMENPKVHLHFGDGREWLLTQRKKYDLILSEPSNPYRAGVASLFTKEFYKATREALEPGGIFLQWVQAYEIDKQALASVTATLFTEFAYVECWQSLSGDLVFLSSMEPLDHDPDRLREKIAREPFRSALAACWRTNSAEGVFARYIGGKKLTSVLADAARDQINTDDKTTLEFAMGRSVGKPLPNRIPELVELSARIGDQFPAGVEAKLDVELHKQLYMGVNHMGAQSDMSAESKSILNFESFAKAKNYAIALGFYEKGNWPLKDLSHLYRVANVAAHCGSSRAPDLITSLRSYSIAEPDFLEAFYYEAKGDLIKAKQSYIQGFKGSSRDMWTRNEVLTDAFEKVEKLAESDPLFAKEIFQILEKPFAGYREWNRQRVARMNVARHVEKEQANPSTLAALATFEPYPKWDAKSLLIRAATYRFFNDRLADQAEADLLLYRSKADTSVSDFVQRNTPSEASSQNGKP